MTCPSNHPDNCPFCREERENNILGPYDGNPPNRTPTIENETQAINAIIAGLRYLIKETIEKGARKP